MTQEEINDILQSMTYSYSSISCFETCKLNFYYNYIEKRERLNGVFGEFGSLCHEVIERYMRKELEIFELAQEFKKLYPRKITFSFPPYPANMEQNYFSFGLNFFENFNFDRDDYQVLMIEDKLETNWEGINLVVKPDLVVLDKKKNKVILIDYKSSAVIGKDGKVDQKKIEPYKNQLNMYAYFITAISGIRIDDIKIWALRNDKFIDIIKTKDTEEKVQNWIRNTVKNIKEEKDWTANNTNTYFCSWLCSSRDGCSAKQG